MAIRIVAIDQTTQDQIQVLSLSGLDNQKALEKIADHFAAVSCEYSPLDFNKLC